MKKGIQSFMKNEGFTLVELVVVIAIVGVITVVLAPKYLDYVEKSKIATDENAIFEVAHAAEAAYVSVENKDDNVLNVYIKSKGNATYLDAQIDGVTTTDKETLTASVDTIIDDASYIYKSKTYRNRTITITVDKETGKASVDLPIGENKDYTTVVLYKDWLGRDVTIDSIAKDALWLPNRLGWTDQKELTVEQKEAVNQRIQEAVLKGKRVEDVAEDIIEDYIEELFKPKK